MDHGATRAAFFDVDETVLTFKSMIRFLEFDMAARGCSPEAFVDVCEQLVRTARTASRADANRAYYRLFAGRQVARVTERGRAWFDWEMHHGQVFNSDCLGAWAEHRSNGDLTVLVSGSFHACLDPVAEHLAADLVVGSVPTVEAGRYTGDVEVTMIGAAKRWAVEKIIRDHQLDPDHCHAYADHESDLPMLGAVGIPVVVGNDPVLVDHARCYGLRRLPGATGSRPPIVGGLHADLAGT